MAPRDRHPSGGGRGYRAAPAGAHPELHRRLHHQLLHRELHLSGGGLQVQEKTRVSEDIQLPQPFKPYKVFHLNTLQTV